MDLLLFLGGEFLKKMTDLSVSEEERESLRYELAAYLEEETGAAANIVEAFNRLDSDELSSFARETALWYLDWVTQERHDLARHVEPGSLSTLWSTFNEPVVRTRAVEALIGIEQVRQVHHSRSEVINLVRLALGLRDERVLEDRERRPSAEAINVTSQIVDTLLTEQSPFALRVLGESLTRMPTSYRLHFQEEIETRVTVLGEARAQELLAAIRGEDRSE